MSTMKNTLIFLLVILTGLQTVQSGKILKKLTKELKKVIGGAKFEDIFANNIADIHHNSEKIHVITDNITSNSQNITSNAEKIHRVAHHLSNATTNIANVNAEVSSNAINIASNADKIHLVKVDVADNSAKIAINDNDIDENSAQITINTANITKNTLAIENHSHGPEPEALLLVANGRINGNVFTDCEVIDMGDPSRLCNNLPSFPKPNWNSAGMVLEGVPIIGGGISGGSSDSVYKYDLESNAWTLMGNLASTRHQHAVAPLNGGIWFLGGYGPGYQGKDTDTDLLFMNGTIMAGPDLDKLRYNFCVVPLVDGSLLILGSGGETSTVIFDPVSSTYTNGPTMIYPQFHSACAHFYSDMHGGRPVVLKAGGKNGPGAEIYDYTIENSVWEQITDIPSPYISTVEGPTGVTSVDGKGAYVQQDDKFFELTCSKSACSWSLMDQTLKVGRDSAVLMYLPHGFPC